MALPALLPAFLLALQTLTPPGDNPRTIILQAYAGVEGDSVPAVRNRWNDRLARDSSDRAARLGLATLDWLTFDHAAANAGFRTLLATNGTDRYALQARLGWAEANLWRISFDTSVVRFTDAVLAARAQHDSGVEVEALTLLGFLRSRTQGFPAGLATMDTVARRIPAGNDTLKIFLECTQAPMQSFSGAGVAWATGTRGLARARALHNRRMLAICYQALAEVAINVNAGSAEAYLDSAETIRRQIHEGPMLAIALFIHGYRRYAAFDLAGARRILVTAVAEAQRTGCRFAEAWARRFLSGLYSQVGDVVSADREFKAAGELFQSLDDHMGLGNMRRGVGTSALALGRFVEADSIFRLSLATAEASGVAEGVYFSRIELAAVQAERGNWSTAAAEVRQAIAYGKAHGHAAWVGSLQYTLGLLALRSHDLAGAEHHLGLALAGSGPTQYLDHYAIHSRLAELWVLRGELPRALAEITTASDQLDSLRNQFDDQTLKLMVFQTKVGYDEEDLGLATIAAALARGGYAGAAFRLSEQRRARTLDDRLVQAEMLQVDSLSHPLRDSLRAGVADAATVGAGLPDDSTALLEYLTGPRAQPTTLFLITRSGLRAFVLPPIDSLTERLTRYSSLLQSGAPAAAIGAELRAALLDSALAALPSGIRRLAIVPDGALHRLPFDALPLADGAPVLTRYAVAMAPSAAVALRLWARPVRNESARILALGDPSFANERSAGQEATTETYRDAFDAAGGLTRLTGSAAEARAVARFSADGVVRLRDEASESYLKHTPLSGFGVIHLATHALVDERTLTRTAIALSPGDGEDGFLGPAELAALKLNAEVVVLSACRTAGGLVVGGEGVQGLTSPILEAGARSVVATMWPVGDRSTGPVMEDFYRGLAERKTVSEALREAKVAAIRRGASPAEWAGFEIIGDPLARVPLRVPPSRIPLALVGVGVALLMVWRVRRLRASRR